MHVSAARDSFYDHKMCLQFQDRNEILIVLALCVCYSAVFVKKSSVLHQLPYQLMMG